MGKILESGIWLFSLALLLVHCDLGGGPNPLWTCFPSAYFVRLHDLPGPLEAKGMHSHVPQCASWGGGGTAGSESPRQGILLSHSVDQGMRSREHIGVCQPGGQRTGTKAHPCRPAIPEPLETGSMDHL